MSIETFDPETKKALGQDARQRETEAALRIVTGKEFLGPGRHVVNHKYVDVARYLTQDYADGEGKHRAEPVSAQEPKRVE